MPAPAAGKQAVTERRKLPAGNYGGEHNGRLVAAVERKSLADLVSSLTGGKLKYPVFATVPIVFCETRQLA